MIDALCTRPLLDLLRAAMEKGLINGWSVEGPNVVLYKSAARYSVLPLVAGVILRDLLDRGDSGTVDMRA